MERTDNTLKILVTVLSILFLLIAIKTSFPAESIGEMTINIAGKFVTYELFLLSFIYVGGPLLSEAMPVIWTKAASALRNKQSSRPVADCKEDPQSLLLLPAHIVEEVDEEEENDEIDTVEDEISDEIIEYTNKTFENILTAEQIEKIFKGLRNFNRGGRFEVIVKEELPDYIYQFDMLHYVWNVTKRIYVKKRSKYTFRDRAAEFAKSSFPLIVTSALESIGSTMSNDDYRTFSLPKIKPGKPLIPHDFSDAKKRKETPTSA